MRKRETWVLHAAAAEDYHRAYELVRWHRRCRTGKPALKKDSDNPSTAQFKLAEIPEERLRDPRVSDDVYEALV